MKANMILVNIAVLAMLYSSALAQGMPPYGQEDTRPICPISAQIALEPTSLLTEDNPNGIEYDWTSNYYDTVKGSVPIFVKQGEGTNDYSFTSWEDGYFETKKTSTCRNTAGYTFFALIERFLMLTGTDNQLYVCPMFHQQSSTSVVVTQIVTPTDGNLNSYSDPKFYFFRKQSLYELYIAYTDLTNTAIYAFNPIDSAAIPGGRGTIVKLIPTIFYSQLHGNDKFLYSEGDNKIKKISDWSDDITYSPPSGSIVKSHLLNPPVVLLTFYSSDMSTVVVVRLGSDVQKLSLNSGNDITSSTPFKQTTDNVANFVLQGSFGLIWYHHKPGQTNGIYVQLPSMMLPDFVEGQILDVGLSGDKIVIFSDSKLYYWKIVGMYNAKQIASLSTTDLDLEGDYQYVLRLGCLCPSISKFVCISSTLNCLIIKKSIAGCGLSTDPFNV